MQKLRIIVGGFIGILPVGGVTWDYIQYPLGFSLLGHDVYYIEDTRLYPIYQKDGSRWDDCLQTVQYLQHVMACFGMKDKWAYRDEVTGKSFNLTEIEIIGICKTADVFVNISCSTFLRDEYLRIPARILIDSDPMFTQIQYNTLQTFTPGTSSTIKALIDAHNYKFSFGENIGAADCLIPVNDVEWLTTRQPICLDYWKVNPLPYSSRMSFTTLMNWSAGKTLHYNDETWGQKDLEFKKLINLPFQLREVNLSMVVNQTGGINDTFNKQEVLDAGWGIIKGKKNVRNWQTYQKLIAKSHGEFSVAKETYVKAKTGWFSCRSACYLAMGRPVITQDTTWSKYIPSGNGLFAFRDIESAIDGFKRVAADYNFHATMARAIAEEYFDSNKVLNRILDTVYH